MAGKIVIHPLNRGIRPIRLEMGTDAGMVTYAKVGTTYYWEFDKVLPGKDPLDALQLTQRMCGLDFISHSVAASRALEELGRVKIPDNAVLSRNILLALDIIYGHVTHFYQTVLPDYVPFPGSGPFDGGSGDYRIPPAVTDSILKNMWRSFETRQLIHKAMGFLGGKVPHGCSVVFGGVTKPLDGAEILKIYSVIKEITGFVNNGFKNDIEQLETYYRDYFSTGPGTGRFLSVGEFPEKGNTYFISSGVYVNGFMQEFKKEFITVECARSWLKTGSDNGNPSEAIEPDPQKQGAYSWVKGALYDKNPCETGALARMFVSGSSTVTSMGNSAVSVLGRHRARLEECRMLLVQINRWLQAIVPGERIAVHQEMPADGEAIGVAEASRGPVVHYLAVQNGKISKYNVLDAFSWNLCPMTVQGQYGPVEQALAGLLVPESEVFQGIPPAILRTARSI